jgi:hypothetical protein
MQGRIHGERLTGPARSRLLVAAAVLSGLLLAGCGGSSHSPTAGGSGANTTGPSTAVSLGTTTTGASSSTASRGEAASAGSTGSGAGDPALAFAECMRANGVPNFPDPQPGRGALFSLSGINPAAPAFRAAQAKCRKFMGGGPPVPGSTTHPSAQTMSKLRRIAVCMRQHGVPQFPDPRTTVPSNPAGFLEITDFDGAILLFPSTINLQAPAYRQALTACGAPPLGLPH